MPRRRRVEFAGATYHVTARGNRREPVFRSDHECEKYVSDLARLTQEHRVGVLAFCLMGNHVHLCLRTAAESAPLSVLMQRLNLRHSQRYNWMNHVRGHLNEGRYRAGLIATQDHLLTVVAYIHQNPVVAGLVPQAADWRFSSHRAYLGWGLRWVQTEEVLRRAGGLAGYQRRMAERLARAEVEAVEAIVRQEPPEERPDRGLVPLEKRLVNPWVAKRPTEPLGPVASAIAEQLGWDLERLACAGRTDSARMARTLLVTALRERGYRLQEIGEVLGRGEAAISRLLGRLTKCEPAREPQPSVDQAPEGMLECSEDEVGYPRTLAA